MVGFAEKLEIPDAEVEGAPEADTLDLTQGILLMSFATCSTKKFK